MVNGTQLKFKGDLLNLNLAEMRYSTVSVKLRPHSISNLSNFHISKQKMIHFCFSIKNFRYGSAAILTLDGGEGRRYNDSFYYTGHQMMTVDKQEGVYAGGKAEYTGVRTFEVYSDFSKGCMDDIRLEGKHLPLPPALNGTQWGQATMARNLQRNCPSNNPCANVICPK